MKKLLLLIVLTLSVISSAFAEDDVTITRTSTLPETLTVGSATDVTYTIKNNSPYPFDKALFFAAGGANATYSEVSASTTCTKTLAVNAECTWTGKIIPKAAELVVATFTYSPNPSRVYPKVIAKKATAAPTPTSAKWITVGNEVGTSNADGTPIYTTEDTGSWTEDTLGTTDQIVLKGVAENNDKWVAVGKDNDANLPAIYLKGSFTDDWTPVQTLPLTLGVTLSSVAYGDGKWMSVGNLIDLGGSQLYTSTNETTWADNTSTLPSETGPASLSKVRYQLCFTRFLHYRHS